MTRHIVIILLLTSCVAQTSITPVDTAKPAPLTDDEKRIISRTEVDLLRARLTKDQMLQQADKAINDATQKFNEAVQSVYTKRKIIQQDYTLCEASGPPLCIGAPENDLTLQPVTKPDTKLDTKKEDKK